MNPRALIFAGVVVLVGMAGFLLLQTTTVTSSGVRVGQVPVAAAACHDEADCLPNFKAVTVDGHELSRADLVGKTVLVNFWATWCGPCVKELPALQATFQRLTGEGFVIVGIAQDGTDESIRQFALAHGVTYPIVRSTPALDRAFGGRPGLLPTSFLYGPDGHMKQQWQRALDEGDLGTVLAR